LFQNIVKLLIDFPWTSASSVSFAIARPALEQASSLLEVVGRVHSRLCAGEDLDTQLYEEVGKVFPNFKMLPEWACAGAQGTDPDKFAEDFTGMLQERFYSDEVQEQAFKVLVTEYKLDELVQEFWDDVPVQYEVDDVPSSFPDLDKHAALISCASIAGDKVLASQLQYVLSFNDLLRFTMELTSLRGVEKLGMEGGEVQLTEEAVLKVNVVRDKLLACQAVCSAPGMERVFEKHEERHCGIMDETINPKTFSNFAYRLVDYELELWRGVWVDNINAWVHTITDGIPSGWHLKKDTLLDCEDVQESLVKNQKYPALSAAVASAASARAYFQKLTGPGFFSVEATKALKEAIASGTECVTITYALYKLLYKIPKEPKKKQAIEALRKEVKAKGVALGTSLEAEAARLEAM